MTHALITFLGRTPRDKTNGYRTTTYHFPDGHEATTAVLGWHLAKRLKPDLVIILGTNGSMWDFLAQSAGIENEKELENAWLNLMEAVEGQTVSDEHLRKIQPLIENHLNIETRLRLIPKGLEEEEQLKIPHIMAEETEDIDQLTLDVSHAFRHLPMIAIVAGVYLQAVQNVQLKALWYGFYDPDATRGTVYDLRGLLHLFDWIRALSQFEHTGDYGVFADLLPQNLAEPMHKAAFFERTTQEPFAKQEIDGIVKTLAANSLPGVAGLFQSTLQERLGWVQKTTPQRRQSQLAKDYLKRRDYLRAALYAQEAFVTYLVSQRGGNPDQYADRKNAMKDYKQNMSNSYKNLRELRNALAHGTEPTRDKVKKMIEDEAKLREQIKQFLDNLDNNRLD